MKDKIKSGLFIQKSPSDPDKFYVESEEFDRIFAKGVLDPDDKRNLKDWVMVSCKSIGWSKYGREMYSPSLDLFRCPDMSEFYGNSVVD